jgi:uncharacterized protein with HEPN domain
MSVNSDGLRLRDMLDRAERILHYAEGRTEDDLLTDPLLQDAVLHCFLILGEAASQVSPPTKDRLAHLPWHEMVGIRNHIVHGYTKVNFHIIWKTVQEDIPPLVDAILEFLPPEQT